MLRSVVSWVFGMPNRYPGAAAIITGLYALGGVMAGISAMSTPSTYASSSASSSVGTGIVIILLSLVVLGLTIYAAVDTQLFQNWGIGPSGNPNHGLVRWTGPVLLGISIIISVFIFIAILEALKSAATNS